MAIILSNLNRSTQFFFTELFLGKFVPNQLLITPPFFAYQKTSD